MPTQDRVLLIDDDEQVAGSLREYLVRNGSLVDVAVDLSSAEHLLDAQPYEVIVVDPYLTGGVEHSDGALLSMIRVRQPSAALIVLTGYGSSALTISAERERAYAVLTKPQSVVDLSELVAGASAGVLPDLQNH
ncbi:MAG TPA: response regulator [Thermoanaerobaculia bacterium]|nr:response regulator [Thermoanaerobaculia bacterium]